MKATQTESNLLFPYPTRKCWDKVRTSDIAYSPIITVCFRIWTTTSSQSYCMLRGIKSPLGLGFFLHSSTFQLGPYLVIISFSSSLSNYYDVGGRALPLGHYNIYTLMYRPCPDRLSFLTQIYIGFSCNHALST